MVRNRAHRGYIPPAKNRNMPRRAAIIVASGRGSRLSRSAEHGPKQYWPLGGTPVIARTISTFLSMETIDWVLPVIHTQDQERFDACVSAHPKLLPYVFGGATRQASVYAGLQALAQENGDVDYVAIHDAVRPLISTEAIEATFSRAEKDGAVCLVGPVVDTMKDVSDSGIIGTTLDRNRIKIAQTPQTFHFPLIFDAHSAAEKADRSDFTDDAAVAEWAGHKIHAVQSEDPNIKITYRKDFDLAESLMRKDMKQMLPRTGHGYDVHAFEDGNSVRLCGIDIPHNKKLKGHSDADVGLHALTDAILGALALGDIGDHFPPSDDEWKDRDSSHFLEFAGKAVAERKGRVINCDITLVCEKPKIGPYRDTMRGRIAEILKIRSDQVGVKATTNEKLGFLGREEGIAAMAVATILLPEGAPLV